MNPSLIPDLPIEIGYKCSWFAVQDTNVSELATVFSIGDFYSCNWEFGLPAAKAGNIFVSPALGGWRLIIGNLLPFGDSHSSLGTVKTLLKKCSQVGGEAHFFSTHRVAEFHCWMKAEAGALVRGYAFIGDQMNVLMDEGAKTTAEPFDLISVKEVARFESDDEAVEVTFPDEDLVMKIAAAWSVNPNDFTDKDSVLGLGIVGAAPSRFT